MDFRKTKQEMIFQNWVSMKTLWTLLLINITLSFLIIFQFNRSNGFVNHINYKLIIITKFSSMAVTSKISIRSLAIR